MDGPCEQDTVDSQALTRQGGSSKLMLIAKRHLLHSVSGGKHPNSHPEPTCTHSIAWDAALCRQSQVLLRQLFTELILQNSGCKLDRNKPTNKRPKELWKGRGRECIPPSNIALPLTGGAIRG